METYQDQEVFQQDADVEDQLDLERLMSLTPKKDENWKNRFKKNHHFVEYLNGLLSSGGSYPKLVENLSRDMGADRTPNYIYPVGDPVFIHIYTEKDSKNIIYKPIEPRLTDNRNLILSEVEKRLALLIDDKVKFETLDEKTNYLYDLLKTFIKIDNKASLENLVADDEKEAKSKNSLTRIFSKISVKKLAPLKLDPVTYERLKYELYCEKVGSSILEPMIRDIYIEDVHGSGLGSVYISHKIFGTVESTIVLEASEELDNFVLKLSEIVGKPVSHRDPIIDATMPDGSRLNIVFGEDVSRRGSNFTIRKFASSPLSICQLINFGTMSSLLAAYVWILLEEKMSIWICGETASGKTTTLSAITSFIPAEYKVVSIEEVPEIYVPHPNWVREVVRETSDAASEEQGSVSMFQLLKAALRQRPNYIIVGEVRGQEGNIAFQAMQTGHPSIATFHASSVAKLVQRLTNYPISVPKTHIDNLNAAVFQSAVHDSETGRYKRRVLSVNEILGYEPADELFNFVEVFTFNPAEDNFIFRGMGTSYILDSKVAVMRGYSGVEMRKIYDEMYLRAEILEYMIALGIISYQEALQNIRWVQRVGVEEAHKRYKEMVISKLGSKVEKEIKDKLGKSEW